VTFCFIVRSSFNLLVGIESLKSQVEFIYQWNLMGLLYNVRPLGLFWHETPVTLNIIRGMATGRRVVAVGAKCRIGYGH